MFGDIVFSLYLCGKILMIWEETERAMPGNTGRQDRTD